MLSLFFSFFFFFNDTATTEIYTLSLHDALPILVVSIQEPAWAARFRATGTSKISTSKGSRLTRFSTFNREGCGSAPDRKSTRLNSSHSQISYAVFCLKKKKKQHVRITHTKTLIN